MPDDIVPNIPEVKPFVARQGSPLPPNTPKADKAAVMTAIRAIQDPELLLNVDELGLIYKVEQHDNGDVDILMTLTSPSCPMGGEIPFWVAGAVASVPGVGQVAVELTFSPPWSLDRLSDEVKMAMGLI